MRLRSQTHAALRALLDLSLHSAYHSPVPVSDIAKRQDLGVAFLEQLFRPLKKAGLVAPWRGMKGGYTLAMAAEEVDLLRVLVALDDPSVRPIKTGGVHPMPRPRPWQPCWSTRKRAWDPAAGHHLGRPEARGEGQSPAEGRAQGRDGVPDLSAQDTLYLDHNAGAPLRPEAMEALRSLLPLGGQRLQPPPLRPGRSPRPGSRPRNGGLAVWAATRRNGSSPPGPRRPATWPCRAPAALGVRSWSGPPSIRRSWRRPRPCVRPGQHGETLRCPLKAASSVPP